MIVRLKIAITLTATALAFASISCSAANEISESQQKWFPNYQNDPNIPEPGEMLINTDPEPKLLDGFVELYNGENLDGWTPKGGYCTFEAAGESIKGVCVPGSPSTYLSTEKADYTDFIFTAELKWEVDGNTGIMFRAQSRPGEEYETVFGPQAEMEDEDRKRYWSGGIYGQSAGRWAYPLWLDAHKEARDAINYDEWNRITIKATGNTVKTWVNGIPAAHWKTKEYLEGFFSLRVHSGKQGAILFRNIKVKEVAE